MNISDEDLEDLRLRLSGARYGEDLVDNLGFQYGFPVRYSMLTKIQQFLGNACRSVQSSYLSTNWLHSKQHLFCREIKTIVEYWLTQYDWRKQEAEINGFPQYKTTIEGIDVHFLRVKPKSGRKGKIPKIFIATNISSD